MIELYFLFYRIPKMMSELARERNRSAVKWSVLAIVSWLGAEFAVFVTFGVLYGLGELFWGWPEEIPAGVTLLSYVLALGAAIGSFSLVRYLLKTRPIASEAPLPPPPPSF